MGRPVPSGRPPSDLAATLTGALVAGGIGLALLVAYAILSFPLVPPSVRGLLDPLALFLIMVASLSATRVLRPQLERRPGGRPAVEPAGSDEIRFLPGSAAGPEAAAPDPVAAPVCEFCRCPISRADRVDCLACETPHHRDCWEEGVGCTTYGCRGTEAVLRTPGP